MKLLSTLLVLLPLAAAKSGRWGIRPATASLKALSVPRGGGVFGSPLTKKCLASIFLAEEAVTSALVAPTPVEGCSALGLSNLKAGSLEAWLVQVGGFSSINVAITLFLSVFTDLSPEDIIAYAVIPCSAFAVNGVLTGSYVKNGFTQGIGAACALFFLGAQYLIFSGNENATNAAIALACAHGLLGVTGFVSPSDAAKLNGVDLKGDASKIAFWRYAWSAPFLVIAAMHGSLLNGQEGLEAAGYGALIYAASFFASVAEGANKLSNVADNVSYSWVTLFTAIGLGILYGE